MALYNFNSQILSSSSPTNLAYGLSSADNSIYIQQLGTTNGKRAVGLAYNRIGGVSGLKTSLSANDNTIIYADRRYSGQVMALIYEDGSTSVFTAVTSLGNTRQSLGTNSFENSLTPNKKRKWNLFG